LKPARAESIDKEGVQRFAGRGAFISTVYDFSPRNLLIKQGRMRNTWVKIFLASLWCVCVYRAVTQSIVHDEDSSTPSKPDFLIRARPFSKVQFFGIRLSPMAFFIRRPPTLRAQVFQTGLDQLRRTFIRSGLSPATTSRRSSASRLSRTRLSGDAGLPSRRAMSSFMVGGDRKNRTKLAV